MSVLQLQDAALHYHEHVWPSIPVNEHKEPLTKWGEFRERQQTAEEVRELFSRPAYGLALLTYPASELVVLDFDGPHAETAWQLYAGISLPRTARTRTRSSGSHFVFRMPPSSPTLQEAKRKIKLVKAEGCGCEKVCGVDLLVNGYFVAPPTPGYTEDPDSPPLEPGRLAVLPLEVFALIGREHNGGPPAVARTASEYAELLKGVPGGMQHDTSVKLIGHLLPKLGPEETWAIMEAWCDRCTPPADKRKVRDNFEDILRREGAKRKRGNGTGKGDHRPDSFLPYKSGVGEETNFRPVKAADLLVQEPEPMDWVWEPFLAVGTLNLLVSYMKVGKSTFAYPLAIAIAQGKPFLGYPTTQGGVLILAVEEHPRDVKRRLRRFGLRTEDPVYVHQGRLDNSPETYKALRNFIMANNVKAVILDTLPCFWSVANENDNAEVIREVSPLLELARETGAVVILLHHERKSGGEDGRSIRGGSALFAIVDQALTLDRRQGGEKTHRVLRTLGRYDETPAELVLDLVGDEYRKLGVPQDLDRRAKEEKVWSSLSEEGLDVPTVAQKAGLTESETRKLLEAMGDRIIREGKGRKGDPYTYCLGTPNSILTQPNPIGEETNFDRGGLPELAPVVDEAETWEP